MSNIVIPTTPGFFDSSESFGVPANDKIVRNINIEIITIIVLTHSINLIVLMMLMFVVTYNNKINDLLIHCVSSNNVSNRIYYILWMLYTSNHVLN